MVSNEYWNHFLVFAKKNTLTTTIWNFLLTYLYNSLSGGCLRGRPKKYLNGFERIQVNIPVELAQIFKETANKYRYTQTELLTKAIELLMQGEFKQHIRSDKYAALIATYEREDLKHSIVVTLGHFQSTKFSNFNNAKAVGETLRQLLNEASRKGLDGEEVIGALTDRLDFIYLVVLPDLYKFMYRDVDDQKGVKNADCLWYSWEDYEKGGFQRPPPPSDWLLPKDVRDRKKTGDDYTKKYGSKVPLLPEEKEYLQKIGLLPSEDGQKALPAPKSDAVYGELLDWAGNLEKKKGDHA